MHQDDGVLPLKELDFGQLVVLIVELVGVVLGVELVGVVLVVELVGVVLVVEQGWCWLWSW